MSQALEYLRSAPEFGVYSEMLLHRSVKFQYPLTSLLPYGILWDAADTAKIHILSAIGSHWMPSPAPLTPASVTPIVSVMAVVNWLGLIGLIVCTAMILRDRTRNLGPYWSLGITAVAALTFYPVARAYSLGQIQIWIDALFAAALLASMKSRKALAGSLIALASLIKPQFALFMLWAVTRREWRFLLACSVVGTLGFFWAMSVYGLNQNMDYFNGLHILSRSGEAFYANQSVNGAVNRIFSLLEPDKYNNLDWKFAFPPYNPIVYYVTMITSVSIIGLVLALRNPDPIIDFCTMGVGLTMASPIAWEHHYGILLPVYVVAYAAFRNRIAALVSLALSYCLTSNFWSVANLAAEESWNIVQSYLFFGALILLATLLSGAREQWTNLKRQIFGDSRLGSGVIHRPPTESEVGNHVDANG